MRLFTAAAIALCVIAFAAQGQTGKDLQMIKITRGGSQARQPVPAEYFTGSAFIESPFKGTGPARVGGARVAFEPGARTAWHTHPLGQTLIVTAGIGRVQRWEGPVEEIRQGDIVFIPPGEKHWHGAAPDAAMAHVAVAEELDGKSVEWLEKVSDAQYAIGPVTQTSASAESSSNAGGSSQPSAAQKLMGDIDPKLADLTDKVLFGDVWERPQLSKRDRSLITVAALIALNRPDQLRSHLALALTNGLTQEELVEAITHLAFYSGWPNAVTAVGIAREVFKAK